MHFCLKLEPQTSIIKVCGSILSGREDLNLRLLAPHASALAGLRYAPIILLERADYSAFILF